MSIVRSHRKRHNFSIIDNSGAEDNSLSWKARGILWYLLTKPDEWIARREDLIKAAPDGKASVDSGFKELLERGYAFRAMKRNERGQIEWITEVFETKEDAEQWKQENQELLATTFTHQSRKSDTVTRKSVNGKPVNGKSVNLVNTEGERVNSASTSSGSSKLKSKKPRESEVIKDDLKVKHGLTPLCDEFGIEELPGIDGEISPTGSRDLASSAYASDEGITEQRTRTAKLTTTKTGRANPHTNGNNSGKDKSSAAANFLRKKEKRSGPRFHRSGVFSPIGAGKQIQRAVLRAMQVWIWDEWADDGFRIAKAPDGSIWYFDPKEGWFAEDGLMPITQMIDMANSGFETVNMSPIDIDALNSYGMDLFEMLKKDSVLARRFNRESAAIICNYQLEEVDWDELPEDAFEESDFALPF